MSWLSVSAANEAAKRRHHVEESVQEGGFQFRLFNGWPATVRRLPISDMLPSIEHDDRAVTALIADLSVEGPFKYEVKVRAGRQNFSLIFPDRGIARKKLIDGWEDIDTRFTQWVFPQSWDVVDMLKRDLNHEQIMRSLQGVIYRRQFAKKQEELTQVILKAIRLKVPPSVAKLLI